MVVLVISILEPACQGHPPPAGPQSTPALPSGCERRGDTARAALARLFAAYEHIHGLLVLSELDGVAPSAREIEVSAYEIDNSSGPYAALAESAAKLAAATDLAGAQDAFGDIERHLHERLETEQEHCRARFER